MPNLANLKWGTGFLPNLQSIPNSPQKIDSCVFFLTGKSTCFLFLIPSMQKMLILASLNSMQSFNVMCSCLI